MKDGFTLAMDEGHASLGMGQHVRARGKFTEALRVAFNDDVRRVQALHMRGVVHRLMGKFGTAHQDFEDALRLVAPDSAKAGRIKRDQGLCYLDQARGDVTLAGKAFGALTASFNTLRHQDTAEASTTLSCLGTYYDFIGDRAQALHLLRRGVRLVRGKHVVYEMNNRVRLAHASVLWRWIGAPLTFVAGVRSKRNVAKLIEFTLLLIGGKRLAGAGRRGLANIQLIMTRR